MFSKNMRKKVIIMCTFSDGAKPMCLETLEKAGFDVGLWGKFNNGMVFFKDVLTNSNYKK